MSAPKITVIMPALNEELNIRDAIQSVLHSFDEYEIAGEIVVVNDGSTDRTEEIIIQEMSKDARVLLLSHKTPHSIGGAFWAGVSKANGDAVCLIPGDNEVVSSEILRYHALLNHVDIIVPFVINRETRTYTRRLLTVLFRDIINLTFRVRFNYTNGTVVYRRKILDEIANRCKGFFYQADILVRLSKRGYLFAEVPYRLGKRQQGKSKAVSFRTLARVIVEYIRLIRDIYFRAPTKQDFSEESITANRCGRTARRKHFSA